MATRKHSGFVSAFYVKKKIRKEYFSSKTMEVYVQLGKYYERDGPARPCTSFMHLTQRKGTA